VDSPDDPASPFRPASHTAPHSGSQLLSRNLALPVVIVGLGGGLISAAYLGALRAMTTVIGPGHQGVIAPAVTLVGVGIAVALLTRVLGSGGSVELLVDNIHVTGGTDDVRQVRSLIPTSLLCIASGGTLGPEAPLVQSTGTFGSWVARRFGLQPDEMRILTIAGMASGFGVLFGAPVGAALFALEILHRRGLQYYEALIPALAGSITGYAINVALHQVSLGPVWRLPDPGPLANTDLLWGAACGVIGAAGALAFTGAVTGARRLTEVVPGAVLPVAGGIVLALLWWWSPFALTNGELQLDPIVAGKLGAGALGVAIAAKAAGVVVTLSARWKGGFIIPLFFMGITGGQLLHHLAPSSNVTVVMVALAIALCVGVTKTPLGSTLVVTQMAGLALLPMAIVAALVALVLTSSANVIETQRERTPSRLSP
jgi:H+/Cl- antiporter ClcA